MMFMPFVGIHSFQDSSDSDLGPGLRVGALVGGYVNEAWSVNAQVSFDALNPESQAITNSGVDVSGQVLELTFSPLFHVGNAKAEFVLGPKLGGWLGWAQASGTNGLTGATLTANTKVEGWTLGGNVGGFIVASPGLLLGALMSLDFRDVLHGCTTATAVAEQCTSSGESSTILGFAFALML